MPKVVAAEAHCYAAPVAANSRRSGPACQAGWLGLDLRAAPGGLLDTLDLCLRGTQSLGNGERVCTPTSLSTKVSDEIGWGQRQLSKGAARPVHQVMSTFGSIGSLQGSARFLAFVGTATKCQFFRPTLLLGRTPTQYATNTAATDDRKRNKAERKCVCRALVHPALFVQLTQ
jgi:hypothetical protein